MFVAWGESFGVCVGLGYVWDYEVGVVDCDWVGLGFFEVDVNGLSWLVLVMLCVLYDLDGMKIYC